MKIAGKAPERAYFIGKHYKKFGHSRLQQEEAAKFGHMISDALQNNTPLETLNFLTKRATP